MGFHGGLIYQQTYTGQGDAALTDTFIADRIHGFLAQAPQVMPARKPTPVTTA